MTEARILAYTITRANTPERCRLLLETLTKGRETAGCQFHWHVYVNGKDAMARSMVESCLTSKIIDTMTVNEVNQGQHPPSNKAIESAVTGGFDYLLRTDDDVEWISKRWLAKLVEASQKLGDKMVLSPVVRGLRWHPPQSQLVEIEGVPIKIIEGPIGGVCRLTPVALLKSKPYVSDVRLPMGGGDAAGVGKWATKTEPFCHLAYCQHINIRHAKSTNQQEVDDPKHFSDHSLYQHTPYIPVWTRANSN